VGLAVDGAAVVGTGIVVVVLGEGVADGGVAQEQRSSAMNARALSGFSSAGVF